MNPIANPAEHRLPRSIQRFSWMILGCLALFWAGAGVVRAELQTYSETSEHDVSLKRQNPIYLHHSLGQVSVQGWVQDRVRVVLKKRMVSESEAAAREEFKKLELVTLEAPKSFEIRVGKNRGVDIVTKLKEKQVSSVTVDLEIRAPYHADLTVYLGNLKDIEIQQWRGALNLNSENSGIRLSKLNLGEPMKLNCAGCTVEISDSKLSGHIFSGGKNVSLIDVEASPKISIDAGAGDVKMERTKGRIETHTTSGRFQSASHTGTLSFQSKEGGLFASALRGNLEAQTQEGQLMVEADSVESYLQLDNQKSDIQISLSSKFEGNLDLFSLRGEMVVQFPTIANPKLASESYGPASPGRLDGYVGRKNKIFIHAYTKEGGVRLLRRVPGVR